MKIPNLMLKLAAAILTTAAVTCCVLANLDSISAALSRLRAHVAEKKKSCCFCHGGECEEYEDWDD
ncbi:MAG: hypothetical protein RR053_02080 [Evtepia sp.]